MSDKNPFIKPQQEKPHVFAMVDQDHPAVKGAYREGYQKGLQELLDFLDTEFMKPSVKPRTPEYKTYLALVRKSGEVIRGKLEAARSSARSDS